VRYWEIIADNLSKAGWSWGWVSAIDSNGRTIWICGRASQRRKAPYVPLSAARLSNQQHGGRVRPTFFSGYKREQLILNQLPVLIEVNGSDSNHVALVPEVR
jgi:hypothetical protein